MGFLGFSLEIYFLGIYGNIILEVNLTRIALIFLYFLVFLYITLIY
jgi:hypothetical protein